MAVTSSDLPANKRPVILTDDGRSTLEDVARLARLSGRASSCRLRHARTDVQSLALPPPMHLVALDFSLDTRARSLCGTSAPAGFSILRSMAFPRAAAAPASPAAIVLDAWRLANAAESRCDCSRAGLRPLVRASMSAIAWRRRSPLRDASHWAPLARARSSSSRSRSSHRLRSRCFRFSEVSRNSAFALLQTT